MVHPARIGRLVTLCALATAIHSGSSAVHAQQTASSSSGTSAASNASTVSVGDLIGWFDCSPVTFADEFEYITQDTGVDVKDLPTAQCAQYKAPLCYEGICEDAKKRTIDVFFKRIQAKDDPTSKPNVWFLQGGPGAASPTMELAMTSLYAQLDGNVNVYTMDHRGTGRSTLLDCVASQVTTSASTKAGDFGTDEVANCAQELEIKFGKDLSAFSITSAATDIKSFITQYLSGSKTFVYGVSYGSALVERLMHLDTKEIVGYVLDGVSTTSGADVKDGMYMSNWDVNFGEVGDTFLSMCATDPLCGPKFPDTSAREILSQLANRTTQTNYCSEMMSPDKIQALLGLLLMRSSTRGLIPAALHRGSRCDYTQGDTSVLSVLAYHGVNLLTTASEEDAYASTLLYYLIIFSEMWEVPTPSYATLSTRFYQASMSTGPIASLLPLYCIFTKDTSSECATYTTRVNYTASPIVYKKDKYWNVAATIPDQASVLLMSGKLDPQTPHKYAERLYKVINGTKKELVTFDYAAHGTLFNTALPGTGRGAPTCGMSILASYVANSGDLSKLNKTCMSSLQMSFEVPEKLSLLMMNTTEPFDGKYVDTYWSSPYPVTKKYVTALIVVSVCTALVIFVIGGLCFRHKRRKSAAAAAVAVAVKSPQSDHLQQTTEIVDDDRGASSPSAASGQYAAAADARV